MKSCITYIRLFCLRRYIMCFDGFGSSFSSSKPSMSAFNRQFRRAIIYNCINYAHSSLMSSSLLPPELFCCNCFSMNSKNSKKGAFFVKGFVLFVNNEHGHI